MKYFSLTCLLFALSGCHGGGGSGNGGTSTDVGGGGTGAGALWAATVADLDADLRMLVAPPAGIDPELYRRIKAELPEVFRRARVQVADYPLLLGIELPDQDNPSGARFPEQTDCFQIGEGTARPAERDAINFPAHSLIKISRPRLSCYSFESAEVRRLALHEYLGLIGISETTLGVVDYSITTALLDAFRLIHRFENGRDIKWIRTCEELEAIGSGGMKGTSLLETVPTATYRLANDIDCAGRDFRRGSDGFFQGKSLQGNFDGNGYTIRNLTIRTRSPIDRLFTISIFRSICNHCVLANVDFENVSVDGGAALVTRNNGTITNVRFRGEMNAIPQIFQGHRKELQAGGLILENLGVISNVAVSLRVNDSRIGDDPSEIWLAGLVASNYGSISNVNAMTEVTGSGNLSGLVGWNSGSISNVSVLTSVNGSQLKLAGGLVAYNDGRIDRAQLRGRIAVVDSLPDAIAGGLVGQAHANYATKAFDTRFPFSIIASTSGVSACGKIPKFGALVGGTLGPTPLPEFPDSEGSGLFSEVCLEEPTFE